VLSKLKSALSGFCDIQDSISQIYRQNSLNYIQASGILTIDQAQEYVPAITAAYFTAYFNSFPYRVVLSQPTVIRSMESRFVNQIVVTRIYYQLFGNTSQPLNAFNYQIRYTRFTIATPSNLAALVARSALIMGDARIDLLNKEGITTLDTMLQSLPQVAVDYQLSEDQKQGLVDSLRTFWTRKMRSMGAAVNSIEIQLGTTQAYFNVVSKEPVTYVYYIMAIDGKVRLRESLPELDGSALRELGADLSVNGLSLASGPYVRTRVVYVDTNSATVAFKKAPTASAIKNSWIQYLTNSDVSVSASGLVVWIVEQNLYYDMK
jgi:hypothetical protein